MNDLILHVNVLLKFTIILNPYDGYTLIVTLSLDTD